MLIFLNKREYHEVLTLKFKIYLSRFRDSSFELSNNTLVEGEGCKTINKVPVPSNDSITSHRIDEARIDLGVIRLGDGLGSLMRSLSSSPCVFSHLGSGPCLLLAGKHTFQSHLSIFIAWWLTYSRVSLISQCLL